MRQRFIQSFPTSQDIQTALDNKELGKPYVALSREEPSIDWNSKEIDYTGMYFTIEALEDGNLAVSKSCQYSINKGEWISIASSATIAVLNGDKVRFKDGLKQNKNYMFSGNTIMSNVYGNIMSLMYGDNFIGQTTSLSTEGLFSQYTGLKDAGNLILPATTLAIYCYKGMFQGCTNLTTAPKLPTTTLSYGCYWLMFQGCTSLTKAPELPATTLTEYCYSNMFADCINLTYVPDELPATILLRRCYEHMFQGCTSLAQAPALPVITLAERCCSYMFRGCTSLTTAPVLSSTSLAGSCYEGMFNGCTSLTTAPELPAETLAANCYEGMFKDCTSLTIAPELPARKLEYHSYHYMFYGCKNLNYVKCLSDTNTKTGYHDFHYWLKGVASTGTFVKHPDATWTTGENGIPNGWTIENAVI